MTFEIVFPGGKMDRITAEMFFIKNMAVLHSVYDMKSVFGPPERILNQLHEFAEKHAHDRIRIDSIDTLLYATDAMIESLKKGDTKQTTTEIIQVPEDDIHD